MRLMTPARQRRLASLLLALGILAWPTEANPDSIRLQSDPVVVVVNKDNGISDLSLKDLRSLLKLERRFWHSAAGATGGRQVMVFLRESTSTEQKVALDQIYEMSAEALEKYWVERVYRGEIASPPSTKGSASQAARGVGKEPGSITLLLKKDVNSDLLKVITIDGKGPGDPGYPLNPKH